ncbi:MAG: hypothetical protein AAF597_04220, partial [Bacteroidota bacterium]
MDSGKILVTGIWARLLLLPAFLGRGTRVLCLGLMAMLTSTCLDEIDLGQGLPLPDGIVVSGRMLAGEEFIEAEVILQELFRFQGSNRPNQIVTAAVTIVNEEGQELPLTYRDGNYFGQVPVNDPDFRVEDGMTFTVNVVTREGNNFFSEPEPLAPALPVGEAFAELSELETLDLIGNPRTIPAIDYKINTPLRYPNGEPAFLRWLMTEWYQLTDESQDPVTMDPKVCYVP